MSTPSKYNPTTNTPILEAKRNPQPEVQVKQEVAVAPAQANTQRVVVIG